MKKSKIFKTKKEAISFGKKAMNKMKYVSGTRGGKIRSSQAKILAYKTLYGYVPIAKRK